MAIDIFNKLLDRIRNKSEILEPEKIYPGPSLIEADYETGPVKTKRDKPAVVITSSVLLSREDSERIESEGQTAIDEIITRIQNETNKKVKISVSRSYDTDPHSLNWGGPGL